MPTIIDGFFMMKGWVSRSELYLNGHNMASLPLQSDMRNGRVWIRPGNEADVIYHARYVDTPTQQRWAYGGVTFKWPLVNLSPLMVKYIRDEFFSSSVATPFYQQSMSNKITVQTFNRASGQWEVYHTWAKFADVSSEATPQAGGYSDLMVTFTAVKPAPEGPNLTILVQYQDEYFQSASGTITANLRNSGDDYTLSTSTLIWDIPANVALNSINTSINIEYSTDNGETWSAIQPPLSNVTNIRAIYPPSIPPQTNGGAIILTITPFSNATFFDSIFTASTAGATDAIQSDVLQVEPFNPIAYNPYLYLNASERAYSDINATILCQDADPVATWGERSSTQNLRLSQSDITMRPIYTASAINSLPGITFDGLDDNLFATGLTSTTGSQHSVFIVCHPTNSASVPGNETLMSSNSLQGGVLVSTPEWQHKTQLTPFTSVGVRVNSGAGISFSNNATNTPQVLLFQLRDSGVFDLYRNGVHINTITSSLASMNIFSSRLAIGCSSFASAYFNGIISEIIVYAPNLDAPKRTAIFDYLMQKYDIS